MPINFRIQFIAALCAIGNSAAFAQSGAVVPSTNALEYRSAFAEYRSFGEEQVQPWKQTNETVQQAGGWRAYAREISAPDASATSLPDEGKTAVPTQRRDPHAGHTKP